MKKIIIFFMALVLIFTVTGCGKKPTAKIENEDLRRTSYKFDLKVDDKDIVTKGSVLVNFYNISKKDEVLFTTKTLTTFEETVSVTGLDSDTDYRCDVLCTYDKKSHIIYSWVIKTKKDGTEDDPIKISNANELVEYMSKDYSEDAFYELVEDIDFATYSNKDSEGKEIAFEGLSTTSSTAFAGTLKGNNKTIKNVNLTTSTTYNGFFGYLKGTIEDVTFENINVSVTRDSSTTTYTGAICGYGYQAKLINVNLKNSKVTVDAKTQYTGGIMGYAFATNITSCNNENVDIKSTNGTTSYVGGITSYICQNSSDKYGKILYTTVSGNIEVKATDTLYYGGIVAFFKVGSTIDKAVANINATLYTYGQTEAGGVIGVARLSNTESAKKISNIVSKGTITYKSIKETDVIENKSYVSVAGLIASATAVKLYNAYSEMDIDIEAQMNKEKNLYSSLVFGRGFEYHTELHNTIVNGSITTNITTEDLTKISVHGYDGSTYDDGGVEKPMSTIDENTVKYVKIKLDDSEYSGAISIVDAAASAGWDTNVWKLTVDQTNKKIDVVFE